MNRTIKDWQGNIIKPGMELVVREVQDFFAGCTFSIVSMNLFTDEPPIPIGEPYKVDDKPTWNKIRNIKLYETEIPNATICRTKGERQYESVECSLENIDMFLPTGNQILCIRGVSDDELEYLKFLNNYKICCHT